MSLARLLLATALAATLAACVQAPDKPSEPPECVGREDRDGGIGGTGAANRRPDCPIRPAETPKTS